MCDLQIKTSPKSWVDSVQEARVYGQPEVPTCSAIVRAWVVAVDGDVHAQHVSSDGSKCIQALHITRPPHVVGALLA